MTDAAADAAPAAPWKGKLARVLVPALGLVSLLPFVSGALALLLGVGVALWVGNPYAAKTRGLTPRLLALSVVLLGAGMNLIEVAKVGLDGLGYTAVTISAALAVGWLLGKRLGVGRNVALLVTIGTAVCGGSAIAAMGPAVRAKEEEISVALITVFLLNGVALLLFPTIGHHFGMSQHAFGVFAALAIHDTSSVVGAAAAYGQQALEVATSAKLARALWIVPLTMGFAAYRSRQDRAASDGHAPVTPKRPWFIAWFLAVAALVTFVAELKVPGHYVSLGAQRLLALTLFMTGLGLSREALRRVGARPMLMGVALWAIVGGGILAAVVGGWMG